MSGVCVCLVYMISRFLPLDPSTHPHIPYPSSLESFVYSQIQPLYIVVAANIPVFNKRWYSTSSRDKGDEARLTHTDPETGEARMVSVTDKKDTQREARAIGHILLPPQTFQLLQENACETSKGNVLTVAQIAGIQAAKSTSQLIPLCHPLMLGYIDVRLRLAKGDRVECESVVRCNGKTGVEMEALTATSVALLTVYDMCKASSKKMIIEGIRVVAKSGGKSGSWQWYHDNIEQ